jgi:hypothetical protein
LGALPSATREAKINVSFESDAHGRLRLAKLSLR